MCNSVIATATSLNNSALQSKADEINDKFMDAFNLFAQCHTIYDSSTLLTDAKINELGMKNTFYLPTILDFHRDSNRRLSAILQRVIYSNCSPKDAYARGPLGSLG